MQRDFLANNKGQRMLAFDLQKVLMKIFERSNISFAVFEVDHKLLPTSFINVNKAFCEKLGYAREELLSKSIIEVYGEPIDKIKKTNNSRNAIDKAMVTRRYLLGKNGVRLPVEIHQYNTNIKGVPIGIAIIIDISEQLDSQIKLDESEAHYKRIVEQMPDAIFICDSNRIIYANKSAVRFLGRKSVKEVVDKPLHMFTHADYYEEIIKQINFVLNKKEQVPNFETKFVRNDNLEFYVNSSTNYLIYHGIPAVQIIVRDITEKKKNQDIIKFMAYHDNMTGLCNLTHFHDKLTSYIHRNKFTNNIAAVLYLDVDGFKAVNDSLGHAIGDKLIIAISNRLKSFLDKNHIVARGFGDEFLILMKDTTKELVDHYTNKIIHGFRESFCIDTYEFYLSMSIGISYYPENGKEAKVLVKNSKIALYNVKENGRDNLRTYDITLKEKSEAQAKIKNNLRKALEKEEFLIHYQPKVDISSGQVSGAEALIRWNYQSTSMIPPSDFIPIAEESRMIVPIGDWVLYNVCKQQIEWKKKGIVSLRTAVNISAVQLQNKNFLNTVHQILRDTKVDPKYLEFEITESALINNFSSSNEVLNELRKIGIEISLDDFGTGYSSLSYLRNLNIDNLKIDRCFIRDISKDKKNSDIVKGIIEMAHALGIVVTAEGVEDVKQLMILKQFECDYMQGYLFSRPLPKEDYEKAIQSNLYKPHEIFKLLN
ncbi:MAG: bifunctional diguanylate cyclase/phosphodiesterase [Clostridia bacterium]|nr:bifunctional diguanylate cyclase/phosphodiesterase [Clostridia bacterium]